MIKSCVRIPLVITAVVVAALPLRGSAQGHWQAEQRYRWDPNSIEWRDVKPIEARVPLNLRHKNRELVRLGSYLVNVVGGCNDCHSAGPQTQFARGGNGCRELPAAAFQWRSHANHALARISGHPGSGGAGNVRVLECHTVHRRPSGPQHPAQRLYLTWSTP